jgi:hypothetical protein
MFPAEGSAAPACTALGGLSTMLDCEPSTASMPAGGDPCRDEARETTPGVAGIRWSGNMGGATSWSAETSG